MTTFTAGVIGIVAIVLFSYMAYTKFANPFASQFTVHVIAPNANGIRPDSVVRIAGVNVGKVQSIQPVSGCSQGADIQQPQQQCAAADLTMTIDDNGLPIHKDATFAIRPRIFLEGNFFIDATQGTPSAAIAPNGYHFPVQQVIEPVQFDQLLTSLQADTRHNLQLLLQQYGLAVKQGGPAYNASYQYWAPAYQYGSIVAHDFLGIQPHDLSNWIDTGGQVNGALDAHPQQLKSLITDLNTTAGAFASQSTALQDALAELPRTLAAATPAFTALNNAFPPLRRFARALIPGVQSTGPMVDASLPFFHQLRLLVRPSELGGLVNDLSATVPALATLEAESVPLQRNGIRPAASCVVNVINPWSQRTVPDQNFNHSRGPGAPAVPPRKVYVEGVDFLPGLAGESRDFDANGPYIRILGTGGSSEYSLGTDPTSHQPLFGQTFTPIMGFQPSWSEAQSHTPGGKRPPLNPNFPCETQPWNGRTDASLYAASRLAPAPGPAPDVGAGRRAQQARNGAQLLNALRGVTGRNLATPSLPGQAATRSQVPGQTTTAPQAPTQTTTGSGR